MLGDICASMGDNPTQEQLAALESFGETLPGRIESARSEGGREGDRIVSGILADAYEFYPATEVSDMWGIIGRPSATPTGPDDIVVSAPEEFGRAYGLLDRPGVYTGRLKDQVVGEINAWVDRTPGAGLALTTINWGLMIAGGPTRLAAALAVGAAQDKVEGFVTDRFHDVGYSAQTSHYGGSGLTWLGVIALSGLRFGRSNGPERRDFQPTRRNGIVGNLEANLTGRRSTAITSATYRQENEIARMFAHDGYNVEQNPVLTTAQRERFGIPNRDPDYLIEGRPFDLYSPEAGASAASIASRIAQKANPASRQADRVVVDLRGSSVTRGQLEGYVRQNPITGLNELRVITTDWLGNPVIRTVTR